MQTNGSWIKVVTGAVAGAVAVEMGGRDWDCPIADPTPPPLPASIRGRACVGLRCVGVPNSQVIVTDIPPLKVSAIGKRVVPMLGSAGA
jgi:hypothetical protein